MATKKSVALTKIDPEKSVKFDTASFYSDMMDVIAKRQNFESSGLDVAPPMSTGLLQVDMVYGGGIRASMITSAADEQAAKTTLAIVTMASAILENVPIIAFADYEGCLVKSTIISYGRGKQARLDELFDLSEVKSWAPKSYPGQQRFDIDTFEPGHSYGGVGPRTGSLYYRGKLPTTKVCFNTGHSLTGHKHKMFVVRNGQAVVKLMEDLIVGETVLVNRTAPTEEIWRPILGFDKVIARRYEVSNHGNVRSKDHASTRTHVSKNGLKFVATQRIKGRMLKAGRMSSGHLTVTLCNGRTQSPQLVHRLVARAFLGKPPKGRAQVLHWDDDRDNNALYNLRYGNDQDNTDDRKVRCRTASGTKAPTAVLTDDVARKIYALKEAGLSGEAVGDKFGVSSGTVYSVWKKSSWKHIHEKARVLELTPEVLKDYQLAAVTSVESTGKKEHVFDISLLGVAADPLPHAIITNGVVTHNSTKNSKPYVQSILKTMGVPLTVDQVFGKKSAAGDWEIRPRVRYRSETILENFYDWLSEILRDLPDKKFVENRWWLVFDEKNKRHKARAGEFVNVHMTKKYGNGLWVEAPDDKIQGIMFVDSYTAMQPKIKDEEDIGNQLSVKASAFSKQLERVKGRMAEKMVTVYGLNHLRDNPMAMFGPKQTEKGGKALQQFSDVRLRQTSRALSAVPFSPKPDKNEDYNESEPSVEFPGCNDLYRYVHVKAIKNKLWTPQRFCFIRLWIRDGQGQARGIDPVFDTIAYLKDTGQLLGTRKAFKLNLVGLGAASKTLSWQQIKQWVLGDRAKMSSASAYVGFKPMNLRKFCFKQIKTGVAEDLYIKTKNAKLKNTDEDDSDAD